MEKENFKSGFIALVGRPNVGKSSLLNALIGQKISIVSQVPQTTRYQIRGVYNAPNLQMVFVDTPGIHSFKDNLTTHLNTIAQKSLEGCDLILYVVDIYRAPGLEEEQVMYILSKQKVKIIFVLNKIDLGLGYLNDYLSAWQEVLKNKKIVDNPVISYLPVSAKTGKNIDELKNLLVENIPIQMPFYDTSTNTDLPMNFRIADIIREKLFTQLKEELPHSLAVEVESIKDKSRVVVIKVVIYVNRVSQKAIVIGKKGEALKEVGQASRRDLEVIYNKKVYLDIWVKVLKDWQDKPRILKELGYWWV